jgi:hypothetical protein
MKILDKDGISGVPHRAARRSRNQTPSIFGHVADRTTPTTQLEQLIAPIMDRRVARKQVLELAADVTGVAPFGR